MAKAPDRGYRNIPASSDPSLTKQYAGHLKHQEHLEAQEQDRRSRRLARLKAKGKKA